MRDIGIRIQRYRLSRYRPPGGVSDRARLLITLGLAGWLIWALFLSDHSVVRLLSLQGKQADTAAHLRATQARVARLEDDLKSANDPQVGVRVLRERHNFAQDGEVLYVIPHVDGSTAPRVDERIPADATTPAIAPPAVPDKPAADKDKDARAKGGGTKAGAARAAAAKAAAHATGKAHRR